MLFALTAGVLISAASIAMENTQPDQTPLQQASVHSSTTLIPTVINDVPLK